MIRFNINWNVRVRLTPTGERIYREHWAVYGLQAPALKPDEGGWTRWALWNLMEVFGPHISMAAALPFETEIELCPEPGAAPAPQTPPADAAPADSIECPRCLHDFMPAELAEARAALATARREIDALRATGPREDAPAPPPETP